MKTKKRLYTMLIWVTAVLCLCSGFTFAACFATDEKSSSENTYETILPEADEEENLEETTEEENLEETTEDVWKFDNSDELPDPPDGAVLLEDVNLKGLVYEYDGIVYQLAPNGSYKNYEWYYEEVCVIAIIEGVVNANILPEFRGLPVTTIGVDEDTNSKALESLTIPDSVTSMRTAVCQGCKNLKSIIIPDSVTGNLVLTFQGCESLEYAVIGSGVEGLSTGVFECCYSLKYVYFTSSVEWMSATAFRACSSLTDIYFYGTQEEFENIEIAHGDFDTWIDNDYYPNATKH
ncbi:MAG: leucine-rich repeat domain-containing protein, partial [Clostridia bacterium]|nr:leucine-rich repeat domain-containing protein [Clostridia bacterium]